MQDHEFVAVSRRGFLAAGGAFLGSTLWGSAASARRSKTISIFHTTDLHGNILPTVNYGGVGDLGGFARCATQIRRWRQELPDSLLVDVGDVYQGTPVGYMTRGRIMMGLFNLLDYDAWVLGNHDFDWGRDVTEGALDLSRSAVLTGNLTIDGKTPADEGGVWAKVRPWVVREVGGFRIGLIGLITPGLPNWLSPGTLGGVAAVDPGEALQRSLTEIQAEEPDAVVVLGHMGWRNQDDLANPLRRILGETEGVDVYLGGHSHQDQPSWMTGNVLCSQASYHGIHCGRIDLTFDADSRRLLERRAFSVLMDSRFEPDPAVLAFAKSDLDVADAEMKRRVCTVAAPILAGTRGSPMSKLFCEAFAAALAKAGTPVDGVFHGTFSSEDVPAGDLTVADCWKLLPYENTLAIGELTGAEIAAILEEDGTQRTLWPLDSATLDPGKRYRIAVNTYDAQSGGLRLPKLREYLNLPESKQLETRVSTREALIAHLAESGC